MDDLDECYRINGINLRQMWVVPKPQYRGMLNGWLIPRHIVRGRIYAYRYNRNYDFDLSEVVLCYVDYTLPDNWSVVELKRAVNIHDLDDIMTRLEVPVWHPVGKELSISMIPRLIVPDIKTKLIVSAYINSGL